jgi:hypothetical protein
MRSIIGNNLIDDQIGALSLVRKFNAAHAYLILEYKHKGEQSAEDIHLVVKRGTEGDHPPKADIVYRENLSFEQLHEVAAGCYSVTWSVTQEEIAKLRELVSSEQVRTANNSIDYHVVGNVSMAGLFGASLQAVQSHDIHQWSQQNSKGSVSDYLLVNGHNCYSWAQAIVMNIGLVPPSAWSECFVKDPRRTLHEGQVEGMREEPNTISTCIIS